MPFYVFRVLLLRIIFRLESKKKSVIELGSLVSMVIAAHPLSYISSKSMETHLDKNLDV